MQSLVFDHAIVIRDRLMKRADFRLHQHIRKGEGEGDI